MKYSGLLAVATEIGRVQHVPDRRLCYDDGRKAMGGRNGSPRSGRRAVSADRTEESPGDSYYAQDEFLNRLAGLYPDLSRMELKIAGLLRLNLSTKEVADRLCLSERSIRNHRYRLRKKLHLSAGEGLTTFLVSL